MKYSLIFDFSTIKFQVFEFPSRCLATVCCACIQYFLRCIENWETKYRNEEKWERRRKVSWFMSNQQKGEKRQRNQEKILWKRKERNRNTRVNESWERRRMKMKMRAENWWEGKAKRAHLNELSLSWRWRWHWVSSIFASWFIWLINALCFCFFPW